MIQVAALLNTIPTSTVTVRTFAPPTIDAFGRSAEGSTTEVTISAPVHPATSRRMLERLKEADRRRETIAVYVGADQAAVFDENTTPAELVYKGATYTVAAVGDYADIGGLYLVLAQKQ